ncbi:MAG: citramalate synthase [Alphaproteobacteria bacterium]|nr:citramalate synthase [Alphaproteobacteria bacterium]
MAERLYLFDTTLRDGAQTSGVDFSVADKRAIAAMLDDLGMDYIEGGWPGANPTDDAFFAAPPACQNAAFTAFGMTRRPGKSAANDPGLNAVLNADTRAVCLVGKSWDFQVKVALNTTGDENLALIRDSIAEAVKRGREALFDAEHFFDGYKADAGYALSCLQAAHEAGARWLVLCDTNGGTLPHEVDEIVSAVAGKFPAGTPDGGLGIHTHDDTGNAVANSLAAVRAGCRMVQGTLNGLGERCGNANLVTLIPTLTLKMGYETALKPNALGKLTQISRQFDEMLNRAPNRHAPYVGAAAFAHKGGLHVSAVAKNPASYEHIDPAAVGNRRTIVVSDQAGRSNILSRLGEIGLKADPKDPHVTELVELVKRREYEGYAYDGAEASFELLARRMLGLVPDYFEVTRFSVTDEHRHNKAGELMIVSEATAELRIGDKVFKTTADGNGPVNAIDRALRKALEPIYPALKDMKLVDYRVRILRATDASGAAPRVMIESSDLAGGERWFTVGVSTNIIDASFDALGDSMVFRLLRANVQAKVAA